MNNYVSLNTLLERYASLIRVPNLFTAPPDIILGAAILFEVGYDVPLENVIGLATASILLYAAGTTLNDYFDAPEDAQKRPERPIPSGDISRKTALSLGTTLLFLGVGVAYFSSGIFSGLIAGLLAMTILAYDGLTKGTAIGFLFMGGTRGLNVLLGTTSVRASPSNLPPTLLSVPLLVLIYIAGVTYMAEGESGDANKIAVLTAIVSTLTAVIGAIGILTLVAPSQIDIAVFTLLIMGFVIWTGNRLLNAYRNPIPSKIGPAVGTCVLGLTVLDAAFISVLNLSWAIAAFLFLVPAVGLSRIIDVT